MKKKSHSIDFLFIVILFFVFVVICVLLVSIGSNAYKTMSDRQTNNNMARTTLSYITNKVRQCSGNESITIEEKNGVKILNIHNKSDANDYSTLIFYRNGYLKEATVLANDDYTLDFGSNLIQLKGFDMSISQDGATLFVTVVDNNDTKTTLNVDISDIE